MTLLTKPVVFIDIETTGLDSEKCSILEVAAVFVTADLDVLAIFDEQIQTDLGKAHWESVALEMHKRTGLFEYLDDMGGDLHTLSEVGHMLAAWMHKNGAEGLQPAGRSVHFDMGFIEKQMPQAREVFHGHRRLDLSGLRTVRDVEGFEFHGEGHRALDDVLNDIRWLRQWIKGDQR